MCKKNFIIYSMLACMFSGAVEPIFAQNESVSPVEPDEKSKIAVMDRKNGNYEQAVFFAGKDAEYELQVPRSYNGEDVVSITVKIGEDDQEVAVSKGEAYVPIEPGQEGYMGVWYGATEGREEADEMLPDYIIAEEIPPIISCAKLEGTDGAGTIVSIRDEGEIVSGIQSYQLFLDGEELTDYTEVKTEKKIQNDASIFNRIDITIPVGEEDGHELSVVVEDQCGNLTEKSFALADREEDAPEKKEKKEQKIKEGDVKEIQQEDENDISVIVPTDVALKFFTGPNMVEGNIQSQDIMLINKSEFPVRVKVTQVKFEIKQDGNGMEPCKLGINVREYNKEESTVDISKEKTFYLDLEAAGKDTDAQALLDQAAGWNPTGPVKSSDYGVLRLEGTSAQGRGVKASLQFEFEKIE